MRRVAVFLVAVLALAGCKIFTVLDAEGLGQGFFDVVDVERLPGGGFVAVGCGFDSAWAGSGIVIVRPGEEPQEYRQCEGPLDTSVADGLIYFSKNASNYVDPSEPSVHRIDRLDPVSSTVETLFTFDRLITAVVKAPDGRLLFGAQDTAPDATGQRRFRIHQVTGPTSSVPVVGTLDIGGADFAVNTAGTIFASGSGRFVDPWRNRVYKVTTSGARTVIAGTDTSGFSGDGGAATSARLSYPLGVDVNAAGEVFVADNNNHRVRRISTTGIIRTVAGGGTSTAEGVLAVDTMLDLPGVVAVDSGQSFWVTDYGNQRLRYVGLETP